MPNLYLTVFAAIFSVNGEGGGRLRLSMVRKRGTVPRNLSRRLQLALIDQTVRGHLNRATLTGHNKG